MNIIPGNAQHIGEREEQQDAFGFSDIEDTSFLSHSGALAVVADGMGGHALGAKSSRKAVEIMLQRYMAKPPDEPVIDALRRTFIEANLAVHEMAVENNVEYNTGTTLTAAVVSNGELHWISAGDSRLYLFRKNQLTLLTRDHIYAHEIAEEVAQGNMSTEDAMSHPDLDALTSYLGLADVPEIDANVRPYPIQLGDSILLCTDGLYKILSEKEMVDLLKADSPQQAAESLVQAVVGNNEKEKPSAAVSSSKEMLGALVHGHEKILDNLTVVIMEIKSDKKNEKKPVCSSLVPERKWRWEIMAGLIVLTVIGLLSVYCLMIPQNKAPTTFHQTASKPVKSSAQTEKPILHSQPSESKAKTKPKIMPPQPPAAKIKKTPSEKQGEAIK